MNFYKLLKIAKEERAIFFHGTSIHNLQSILSNGLQPFPKQRAWSQDDNTSLNRASRVSYGGVYLTKNLGTATGAALHGRWRSGESTLIVCVDGQPRSFVADEDDIAINAVRMRFDGNMTVYLAAQIYWAIKLGTDTQLVEKYKKEYVENMVGDMKWKSNNKISPQLEERLKLLFEDLWPIVVARSASHFPKEMGQYWKSSWERIYNDYSTKEDEPPMPPDPQEMELKFREKVDKITHTMKFLAHNTPEKIKIHYGKLPEEFISQYKEKRGSINIVT